MFQRMADVLESRGELFFKVNAYRKAAQAIIDIPEYIEVVWSEGRLLKIPGIGEGLGKKIDEFLKTGRMSKYEEITSDVPGDGSVT